MVYDGMLITAITFPMIVLFFIYNSFLLVYEQVLNDLMN